MSYLLALLAYEIHVRELLVALISLQGPSA